MPPESVRTASIGPNPATVLPVIPVHVRRMLFVVVLLIGTACAGDGAPSDETIASELDPVGVVEALLTAVDEGRFDDTAQLTDSSQAGLLSLAEGADANDVVAALDDGGVAVVANFWSGYAQTLEEDFDPGELGLEAGEVITEEDVRFVIVTATQPSGDPLRFVLRRDEAWRIDLMGTFGPVLAERLIPPVEALLSSANSNAGVILARLSDTAPSLRVAAESPDVAPAAHQSILTLIERVTRAG